MSTKTARWGLESLAGKVYDYSALSHDGAGIGVPELRRTSRALQSAVFLCSHGWPFNGRPCRGDFGPVGPQSDTPTLHGSPSPVGVGEGGKNPSTEGFCMIPFFSCASLRAIKVPR